MSTIKGGKPKGNNQWKRENYYIYGLGEPASGETFMWEFLHLNTKCFNRYLKKFAETYPEQIHIIQLDNGGFHISKSVEVPENIVLLMQPAQTPPVNPIERLWQELKRELS